MAAAIDHTQPQFPGQALQPEWFYYVGNDEELPSNAIFLNWDDSERVVLSSYDTVERWVKHTTDGWWASKNLTYRPVYNDLTCAMFTACHVCLQVVKDSVGSHFELQENPVYFKGKMSSHLLSGLGNTRRIYEAFTDVAEPFATAMEMTWNSMQMFKAPLNIKEKVANEMNYRMYAYALSLAEGRPGHQLQRHRRGLLFKEWVQKQVDREEEPPHPISHPTPPI